MQEGLARGASGLLVLWLPKELVSELRRSLDNRVLDMQEMRVRNGFGRAEALPSMRHAVGARSHLLQEVRVREEHRREEFLTCDPAKVLERNCTLAPGYPDKMI